MNEKKGIIRKRWAVEVEETVEVQWHDLFEENKVVFNERKKVKATVPIYFRGCGFCIISGIIQFDEIIKVKPAAKFSCLQR